MGTLGYTGSLLGEGISWAWRMRPLSDWQVGPTGVGPVLSVR